MLVFGNNSRNMTSNAYASLDHHNKIQDPRAYIRKYIHKIEPKTANQKFLIIIFEITNPIFPQKKKYKSYIALKKGKEVMILYIANP